MRSGGLSPDKYDTKMDSDVVCYHSYLTEYVEKLKLVSEVVASD